MLEARHQGRVAQAAVRPQRGQHIGHHGAIDADVFLFIVLARPGCKEDVAGIEARQRGGDGGAIRRVELQGRAAGGNGRAARETPVTCQPCASRCVASWLPMTPLAPMMRACLCMRVAFRKKNPSYPRLKFLSAILFHPIHE
jgi:hypothetical protein